MSMPRQNEAKGEGGDDGGDALFEPVAEAPKDGFETCMRTDRYVEFAYVEALDEQRGLLGTSPMVRTYRPPLIMGRACSVWMCPEKLPTQRDNASCVDGEVYDGSRAEGQVVPGGGFGVE